MPSTTAVKPFLRYAVSRKHLKALMNGACSPMTNYPNYTIHRELMDS